MNQHSPIAGSGPYGQWGPFGLVDSGLWLIGVGAVIALPSWLAAAWYMAAAASSRLDPSGRFPVWPD